MVEDPAAVIKLP